MDGFGEGGDVVLDELVLAVTQGADVDDHVDFVGPVIERPTSLGHFECGGEGTGGIGNRNVYLHGGV